jgi:hypothetical protein
VHPDEEFDVSTDPLGVLDLVGLLDVVVYLDDMEDENSAGTATSSPRTRCSPSARPR